MGVCFSNGTKIVAKKDFKTTKISRYDSLNYKKDVMHHLDIKRATIEAMDFIARFEGLHLEPYQDTNGLAICYGNHAKKGEKATLKQCQRILKTRVKEVQRYVLKLYPRLTTNQLVSLTSLYYNVKSPNTVLWRYNNGYSNKSISNAIKMYNVAGGKVLMGLVRRRNAEANLFLKND